MYDVQKQRRCLEFKSDGQNRIYRGTTDCVLAPFGLLGDSRATCMRVALEHKKPLKQAADAVSRCMCGSWCVSCGSV
jgi:hypothetical protein